MLYNAKKLCYAQLQALYCLHTPHKLEYLTAAVYDHFSSYSNVLGWDQPV